MRLLRKYLVLIAVLLVSSASANTINVPADYSTIQGGIDAAVNGDTVLVQPGTYVENITIYNNLDICLASTYILSNDRNSISQTIIDGDSSGSVIRIFSSASIIGLTIRNGGFLSGFERNGAGININKVGVNVNILHCIIESNHAEVVIGQSPHGGGLFVDGPATVNIENSIFRDNSSTSYGGAIYVYDVVDLQLKNVLVTANSNENTLTGIIHASWNCTVAATFCTIADNNSVHASFYTPNSILALNNSIIWNPIGDGEYDDLIDPLFISSTDYHLQDYSPYIGTGSIDTTISYDIEGNPRPNPPGSNPDMGAYENPLSTPQRKPLVLNVPDEYPTIQAALTAADSTDTVLVQPGTYYENIIWPDVNGIKLISAGDSSNTVIDGGGISSVIYMNPASATIDSNTVIQGLKITNGGNIGKGGGIFIGNASPALTRLLVTCNTAWDGGGLYTHFSSPTITNVAVIGNTASYGGGGLYINFHNPTLTDITVTGNTANLGGGLYIGSGSPALTDVTVTVNIANLGGGLYIYYSSPTITNVTVTDNTASYSGGLWIDYGGTITISNSNIAFHGTGLYNADNAYVIEATNNWWGDTSGPYHPTQNPSGQGDSVNAFVNITPWLTEPDTAAPPIPIQNLTIESTGYDFVELSWDASPIGDLAGYKVYFNTDTSGFPYTDTIDVGNDISTTLSGLGPGLTYYIAATCYDTDGNESWYSEEVSAVTRILEVQNLDVGGDEDLLHLVTHTPTISFDYYDSMGEPQTTYHIQISTLSDFSSIDVWDTGEVASDATTVTFAGNPLGDGLTYYLQVKVACGGFWSDWATLPFRMNSEPSAPIAVAPVNNAVVSPPVILKVLNSIDAEEDTLTYSFRVYGDDSLSTLLDSAIAVLEGQDTTSWQVAAALPDNGQYWWTASANDCYEESAASDTVSLLLNAVGDAPIAFALLFPQDSAEVATLTPLLDWEVASDPDPVDTVRYSLYLDTPDPGVEVISTDTATSYQVVSPLIDNITYYWKVVARDLAGATTENTGGYHSFVVWVLGLDELAGIPEEFALHQNYPNPFNPSSTIRYDIPEGTPIRVIVFDIVGREIVRLIDSSVEPGYHQAIWNGRDRVGREVPTGIYIARLFTPQYTKSIKMVLLK